MKISETSSRTDNPSGLTVSDLRASTPGPWFVSLVELNARLIAAAPDMLVALREVQHSLKDLDRHGWSDAPYLIDVVAAAIAKAEAVGDRTDETKTAAGA